MLLNIFIKNNKVIFQLIIFFIIIYTDYFIIDIVKITAFLFLYLSQIILARLYCFEDYNNFPFSIYSNYFFFK